MNKIGDDQLALKVAERMMSGDGHSRNLGMNLESADASGCCMSLVISNIHVNGHGNVHGGVLFSLADTAFAHACNAHNQVTVAQQCEITFLRPAGIGEHLEAFASLVDRQGRSAVYHAKVTNQDGEILAIFKGLARTIRGQIV